jgi:hypothetical protein
MFLSEWTELSPDLQIIVLEHAYFDEQPRFKDALVNNEDWFGDTKLIPQAWIDNVGNSLRQGNLFSSNPGNQ